MLNASSMRMSPSRSGSKCDRSTSAILHLSLRRHATAAAVDAVDRTQAGLLGPDPMRRVEAANAAALLAPSAEVKSRTGTPVPGSRELRTPPLPHAPAATCRDSLTRRTRPRGSLLLPRPVSLHRSKTPPSTERTRRTTLGMTDARSAQPPAMYAWFLVSGSPLTRPSRTRGDCYSP